MKSVAVGGSAGVAVVMVLVVDAVVDGPVDLVPVNAFCLTHRTPAVVSRWHLLIWLARASLGLLGDIRAGDVEDVAGVEDVVVTVGQPRRWVPSLSAVVEGRNGMAIRMVSKKTLP
mmetsp:Transcript_16324/g.33194  ORF Transcript_16324/g.33194 Transcript_16324/m.33194 type:complete len:116 (-) Transcript_16324:597-944(-)